MYLSSKGYKIPERGDNFWSYLIFNWLRMNDHTHNGTDSEQLSPKNFTKSTANIASGSWAAVTGHAGTYKQTITVPTGYTVAAMQVKFYESVSGDEVHPTVRKVTATTYDVYINDNTLSLVAVYG